MHHNINQVPLYLADGNIRSNNNNNNNSNEGILNAMRRPTPKYATELEEFFFVYFVVTATTITTTTSSPATVFHCSILIEASTTSPRPSTEKKEKNKFVYKKL